MALGIFLFLKQIVDMFYQWQILDYGMVLFALALLGYGLIQDKTYLKIKSNIKLADVLIIGLALIYLWSFLRDTGGYASFFKIESAFLLYFLGRVYGRKLLDYGYMLAIAGYIVIYLNLLVRFIHWGCKLFGDNKNDGGMYYYKTDLAVGIIIATIFIYFFGRNKILKWITIGPAAAYMVFYSNARMQWPVLIIIYIAILIYEIKNRKQKDDYSKKAYKICTYIFLAFILIVLIAIQFFNFDKYEEFIHSTATWDSIVERVLHSRQVYWFDILYYFREQPFVTRFIGIDMTTISRHNFYGDRAHSEYVEHLYATGYLGSIIILSFWYTLINTTSKIKDSAIRRISTLFIIFFLVTGLTIESLELTQMSWFVFLFAGVTISEESRKLKA